MSHPQIGIMLMAYNQGHYVDETIASLRRQTCQDFEVNLVDDGSNDGFTPAKLAALDYDKITQKHLYDTNQGVAARQRQQYKNMPNDYIMILCGDDALAPTFLEKTRDYLENHRHCGAVSTNIVICFDDHLDLEPPNFISEVDASRLTLPNIIAHENFLGSSLMRKAALDSIDLSPEFKRYQDWDRWVSMLEQGWTLGNIPEPLFFYRQVPSSLAHSATTADELEVRRVFYKRHHASIREHLQDYYLAMERRDLSRVKEIDQRLLSLQESFNRLNDLLGQSESARSAAESRAGRAEARAESLASQLDALKQRRFYRLQSRLDRLRAPRAGKAGKTK